MADPETPATITASVTRHGATAPGRDALVVGRHRRTYGDLSARVEATAALLRASGVAWRIPPRVGILMAPCVAFFEVFLGAGAAGMAAMVLQRSWSDRELRHALAVGAPALVLGDAGRAAPHAPCPVLEVGGDGAPAVFAHWARHAAPPAAGVPAERAPAATRQAGADDGPAPPVDGSAPFYIGFTSGSTGRPKGFVRSHRSWLRSFAASDAVFGISEADHVLAPGPLDHSLFLYAAVHGLSVGATVHLRRRFAPDAVLETLATQPITRLYLVPTMLTALLRAADRRGKQRFPTVASVICSGARWPVTAQERVADLFPNAELIDFYGASELSFVSVRRARAGDPPECIGRPFPGVEVAIRREDGTAAGLGEPGRLWVRSDMLFDGYLEPDPTGATRDAAGWVTVGDVARRDARGRLHLLGRQGAMLVCGGVNVYPEEIEGVLMEVPEVADAAVVGIPDDYWGDLLCALVRWRPGSGLPRRRLREHCHARLASGKRPHRWLEVTEELPRTGSGKLARAQLAHRLRAGTVAARELR